MKNDIVVCGNCELMKLNKLRKGKFLKNMKNIIAIVLTSLFTTITWYVPNGETKVWENVKNFGFVSDGSFLTKGYSTIPVLWFEIEQGKRKYISGIFSIDTETFVPYTERKETQNNEEQ